MKPHSTDSQGCAESGHRWGDSIPCARRHSDRMQIDVGRQLEHDVQCSAQTLKNKRDDERLSCKICESVRRTRAWRLHRLNFYFRKLELGDVLCMCCQKRAEAGRGSSALSCVRKSWEVALSVLVATTHLIYRRLLIFLNHVCIAIFRSKSNTSFGEWKALSVMIF